MTETGNVPGWQQISASRMAIHERCQRQYWYRYRRWTPEEARPILVFGRSVEEAILKAFEASPPALMAGSVEDLLAWAAELAAGQVGPILQRARAEWEADPNRCGDWEATIDVPRGEAMARRAFDAAFHGRHVEACLDAAEGDLLGAWAYARPRHGRTDGEPFADHIRIPPGADAWFSGAFDLWYVHSGKSSIVDIKSSQRGGIFSSQYGEQLAAYCWIHREIAGRLPDSIELWYLGETAPFDVEVPSHDTIDRYAERARALFELPEGVEDDYPAEPVEIPGDERGGWCSLCSFRPLCPRTREEAAAPPGPTPLATATTDHQLVTVSGRIAAIKRQRTNDKGTRIQRFVLADTSGNCEVTLFNEAIDKHLPSLSRGDVVTLEGARVNVWKEAAGLVLETRATVHREG